MYKYKNGDTYTGDFVKGEMEGEGLLKIKSNGRENKAAVNPAMAEEPIFVGRDGVLFVIGSFKTDATISLA